MNSCLTYFPARKIANSVDLALLKRALIRTFRASAYFSIPGISEIKEDEISCDSPRIYTTIITEAEFQQAKTWRSDGDVVIMAEGLEIARTLFAAENSTGIDPL